MPKLTRNLFSLMLLLLAFACTGVSTPATSAPLSVSSDTDPKAMPNPANLDTATFGGGCFWCTEAIFQNLKGVHKVESGYSNGKATGSAPTYKQVCTGSTGYAEVIQVVYDPAVVDYATLLEVFWKTHDPTTLNRQGADVGTQYRSAVFFHNDEQRQIAESYKAKLDAAGIWPNPIVTEITAVANYYPAEDYHQNYYNENSSQPYCAAVIGPKLEKFKKVFSDKLK